MAEKLPPSAAAVYWLLIALGDRGSTLTTKELIQLSMLGDSTFYQGARVAEEAGLIRRRRTGYTTLPHVQKAE